MDKIEPYRTIIPLPKIEGEADDEENSNEKTNFINFDTKTIVLFGTIDNIIASKISDCIEVLAVEADAPLTVKINSTGGMLESVQSIITELNRYSGDINIDIVGCAYSGAGMIALSGDHIIMSELGSFMIHYPKWSTNEQNLNEYKRDTAATEEYFNRMMQMLLKGTKYSFARFKKDTGTKGDLYFTPKECLKYGFVHEVY